MTSDPGLPAPPRTAPPSAVSRSVLAQLRLIAVHQETASLLELRADRSPSPALACVLRDRAGERRRRAELIRGDLAGRGVSAERPPWRLR